jgi:hypothetical protein
MVDVRTRHAGSNALSLPQEAGTIATNEISQHQDSYVVVTRGTSFKNWSYTDMPRWARGVYNAGLVMLHANPLTGVPIVLSACTTEKDPTDDWQPTPSNSSSNTSAKCADSDHDGYKAASCGGNDCNDGDGAVHLGAKEICNGKDDNCSQGADEGFPGKKFYWDYDGDGYGSVKMADGACWETAEDMMKLPGVKGKVVEKAGDCDDKTPYVHPGLQEIPGNGKDDDCEGGDAPNPCIDTDVDNDGYMAFACKGQDCDDFDAEVHPGHKEVPENGKDDDCDGKDLVGPCAYPDEDGDGFTKKVCAGDDCDDTSKDKYPGHGCPLPCPNPETYYKDNDGDGYGVESYTACAKPKGYAVKGGDCDDSNANVYPVTYYEDYDGDGYGVDSYTACTQPKGYAVKGGDCDDFNAKAHPGAYSSGPYCKGASLFAVDSCSKKEVLVKACAPKEVCTNNYQINMKSFSTVYVSACCEAFEMPFSDCYFLENKSVVLSYQSCKGFEFLACSANQYCSEISSNEAFCKKK